MKRYFLAILSVAIFTVACKKSIETIVEPSKQITKTTRSVNPTIRWNPEGWKATLKASSLKS